MQEENMKDDDIDRILFQQDEIVPSSGFAASVMDAVRREASAPPPIPFPWKRALPIVLLAAFALALALVVAGSAVFILHVATMQGAQSQTLSAAPISLPSLSSLTFHGDPASIWVWLVISLVVAWALVKLSMRLSGGSA
ncbi:MAG: hypothetical protein WCA92_03405 [Terriglobales bacterium]|jgi:hypothetical protein